MMPKRWIVAMCALLGTGLVQPARAQLVARSQRGVVSQRVAQAEITVEYSRPVARGRDLFGGIVRYGRIWNPGADSATRVIVSHDVLLDGHMLPAGRYSLWVIPNEAEWTIIFNRTADTWHSLYPGEQDDELRLTVRPEETWHMETLAFYFPVADGRRGVLALHWGETVVHLPIEVER